MKSLLAALLVLFTAAPTAAVPTITFDTVPDGAGGTITYDGAGGPAVGQGIVFVNVQGLDTPLNSGAVLSCVSCALAFTTGANQDETPPGWSWAGGGTITLTGTIPAIGINAPTDLLTGSFIETANTPGLASTGPSAIFLAFGFDTKDATLAAFYGLGPDFAFANTEIALDTFSADPVTNAFVAIPNQADIINAAQVPGPIPLVLLGLGLLLAGPALRKRCSSRPAGA